ncbi:hypothetical protein Mycch_1243 [Mycolicibacterium chubuense NBB4]|uniref:Uncharacterized protein n=1 Tax=Mycolicibacterium chubuense (strain NBB4) TaxID=710421 RepID=I4BFJ4_MYCCN|nr:hypothetical protein [Mycolicibacterium chubuense]AFM16051.1 hypothetical protein Mycch_1243 [Mycolicibacterium chubuense NBB4]
MRLAYLLGAPVMVIAGITVLPTFAAPTARADCVATRGTMICSDNPGAGDNGNLGPMTPYPCDLDWYCDIGGSWDLGDEDVVGNPPGGPPDIGRPGRPDIGRPGSPGNRPGGGGGSSGGGPGGR